MIQNLKSKIIELEQIDKAKNNLTVKIIAMHLTEDILSQLAGYLERTEVQIEEEIKAILENKASQVKKEISDMIKVLAQE